MDRNIQRIGLINCVTMLGIGLFGCFTANYAGSLSSIVAAVFIGFGFLISMAAHTVVMQQRLNISLEYNCIRVCITACESRHPCECGLAKQQFGVN